MHRRPDWEERLHAFIARRVAREFAWGRHDCVMFCMGAVRAMTGHDPAYGWRRKYNTALGSARTLKEAGFADVGEAMSSILTEIPIGFAQRGDVVQAQGSLGVCMGSDGLFVGEEGGDPGLVRVSRGEWERAWRVAFED